MSQLKVLLVSPCHGEYGGIEAFVLAVAEEIRRHSDFEVRVCFKKAKGFVLRPSLETMVRDQDVSFVDRAGKKLIDQIKWADLVHLQNASPDVVLLAKVLDKPIVLTIHNYMHRDWSLHRWLWRMGANLADARWYNSNFVWETWEGNRKRRGSRKVPTVSKLAEGWTSPDQRRGFVFIGRWIANKGIETLLEAYAQASIDREKWPLTLMGDGPLREKIDNQKIAGVQSLGFVDENTKNEKIRNARWIVVPPNTNEDFGLTAIEARNLGVPCIITHDGGLPEAGGSCALICEPNNPTALARLLERATSMDDKEYVDLATRTRDELKQELQPLSFYPDSYRRILRGETV